MDKAEQLLDSIPVPAKLTDQQVKLVKLFVKNSMHQEGFNIGNFCRENKISTATWYSWKEEDAFQHYLNQVQDAVIPSSEKEAYELVKKKILKIAEKQNPSIKELELFMEVFSYVVKNDARERAEALGLTDDSVNKNNVTTINEKKNRLLQRLQD